MKKKIIIGCILAFFMLMSVSFISSAEVNTNVEKKESPLYRLRTARAITEKISKILVTIKTNFIGERMLWIPKCFSGFIYDWSVSNDPPTAPGPYRSICCTGPTPTCTKCSTYYPSYSDCDCR